MGIDLSIASIVAIHPNDQRPGICKPVSHDPDRVRVFVHQNKAASAECCCNPNGPAAREEV
jgi:hypothetical protein